jgi:hypothetical protein
LGIYFNSNRNSTLKSFLHFPLQQQLLSISDANWGPQDASLKCLPDLPLFVSQSMSAYYIDLFGPLHWLSKRQSVTAGSSAKAEIYTTDECVNSFWSLNSYYLSLRSNISLCLPPILSIMIIRHVLTGLRPVQ